jgi:hypothetical protein
VGESLDTCQFTLLVTLTCPVPPLALRGPALVGLTLRLAPFVESAMVRGNV